MKRYIIADLKRLVKRVPRWIIIGLGIVLPVIILCVMSITSDEPMTGSGYATSAKVALQFCGLLFGLFEISYIYGDDFKAKSMQIAIGSGISRRRIVNTKWVTTMIVVAFDLIALAIPLIITGFFTSHGFSATDIGGILLCGVSTWLTNISVVGVCAILIFAMQGTGLGVLLYLAIQFSLFEKILDMISSLCHIERFHLSSYELCSLNNVFAARLELGRIHFSSLLGILIYMAISFVLTVLIFRKRELEF